MHEDDFIMQVNPRNVHLYICIRELDDGYIELCPQCGVSSTHVYELAMYQNHVQHFIEQLFLMLQQQLDLLMIERKKMKLFRFKSSGSFYIDLIGVRA